MIHTSLACIPSDLPVPLSNGVIPFAPFWWGVISLGIFAYRDARTVIRTIETDVAFPVLFRAKTILLECLPIEFFSVVALCFSFSAYVSRLGEVMLV